MTGRQVREVLQLEVKSLLWTSEQGGLIPSEFPLARSNAECVQSAAVADVAEHVWNVDEPHRPLLQQFNGKLAPAPPDKSGCYGHVLRWNPDTVIHEQMRCKATDICSRLNELRIATDRWTKVVAYVERRVEDGIGGHAGVYRPRLFRPL